MHSSSNSTELPADPHAAAVELLRRIAQDGNKAAFADLYDRFAGAVFAVILTIIRDRAEAEDILQDCFCSIWDHAEQYDPAKGKAVSWIMTIARHKALDYVAKLKRQTKIADRMKERSQDPPESVSKDAFHSTALNEESQAVQHALKDLPQDQRQAIQLAFINGMTQTEVGTIKARIRRGLYQMRGALQPYLADSVSS